MAIKLQGGIWDQEVHIPGLMLCPLATRHFAPMETELQTRTMAELMNFGRLQGGSIDLSSIGSAASCWAEATLRKHHRLPTSGSIVVGR